MEERQWGYYNASLLKIDAFTHLSEEQNQRLREIWGEEKEKSIFREMDIHGELQGGYLTNEEAWFKIFDEKHKAFILTQQRFYEEFGIVPIKG